MTSGLPLQAGSDGKLIFGEGLQTVTEDIRYKKDILDVLYDPQFLTYPENHF